MGRDARKAGEAVRGRPAGRGARRAGPRVPSVRLSIPSDTSYLGLVRDLSKRMAEVAGFDDPTADRVALAVDEATTNVIEHAYHGAAGHEVEVRFEDRGRELRVEILDTGAMVDPRTIPRMDPERDLARYATERRTGGLGVHLMEKIMDSVTFRRTARRNVCCLVKRKAPGAGEPG